MAQQKNKKPFQNRQSALDAVQTILGSDPEHVFREKQRLSREISANPLAAIAAFGTSDRPIMGSGGLSQSIATIRALGDRAFGETITPEDAQRLQQELIFAQRHGAFNRLTQRRAEVVKQREAIEAARKRAPGRTQTILTRREG